MVLSKQIPPLVLAGIGLHGTWLLGVSCYFLFFLSIPFALSLIFHFFFISYGRWVGFS